MISIFRKKRPLSQLDVQSGNRVYLLSQDGQRRLMKKPYPGLVIHCHGRNNTIILAENINFIDSEINIAGESHTLSILQTPNMVKNLIVNCWGAEKATIEIDQNFQCAGFNLYISGQNPIVKIGESCLFSWDIHAWVGDAHAVIDRKTGRAFTSPTTIFRLGERVWVGHGVSFSQAVTIPNDTIIGTRAVVTRNFSEPFCLLAGNPADIKKRDVIWFYPSSEWYNAILDDDVTPDRLGFWSNFVRTTHLEAVKHFYKKHLQN